MFRFRHRATRAVPAALLRLLCLVWELVKDPCWLAGLVPLLGGFMHLSSNDLSQPLIARQPEHKVHAMVFAPTHQLVTAEPGVPAQDDFHFRPRYPNLRHNPLYFLKAAERRVVVGFPQTRAQNMLSAEDVQRQITIAVVIAVEEPPLLLAVQRQVGSIHVQNDRIGSLLV